MRSTTSNQRSFSSGKASVTATPLHSVANLDSRRKPWTGLVFWSSHYGPLVREQLLGPEFLFILVVRNK